MRTRYYVMHCADKFQVMREGKPKGTHATKDLAMRSTLFMASIEGDCEILSGNSGGRLVHEYYVGSSPDERRSIMRVGFEEVLAAA